MRLNKHRDYSTVHGMPGVSFAQDGRMFRGDGTWVPEESSGVDEAVSGFEPVSVASEATVSAVELHRDTQAASTSLPKDDMRIKENKALKLQMENFGEEWRGVAHAKKFLGVE